MWNFNVRKQVCCLIVGWVIDGCWYLLMIDHWWRGIGDWCFFGDTTVIMVMMTAAPPTRLDTSCCSTAHRVECAAKDSLSSWTSLDQSAGCDFWEPDRHGSVYPTGPTASAGHGSALQLWRDVDIVQFNVREQTEASGSLWHQSKVDEFQPGHMISFYSYGIFETCHIFWIVLKFWTILVLSTSGWLLPSCKLP